LQVLLGHLKVFLPSQAEYDWTLKYIACLVQGKRTNSILYLYARKQGIGKSFLIELIVKLLGRRSLVACLDDLTKYSGRCIGKTAVILEELPEKQSQEYHTLINTCKGMTTADEYSYRDIYAKAVTTKCVNNIMMSANYFLDAKEMSGRRFALISSLENESIDWSYLQNQRDKNIQAVFNFFANIDVEGWNAQTSMPESDIKSDMKLTTMPSPWEFLKNQFLLTKQTRSVRTAELFDMYKLNTGDKKYRCGLVQFGSDVREIGIKKRTVNGYDFYDINHDDLYKQFTRQKLLSKEEIFAYENGSQEQHEDFEEVLKAEIVSKDKKIEQMAQQIKDLQEQLAKLQPKKVLDDEQEQLIMLEREAVQKELRKPKVCNWSEGSDDEFDTIVPDVKKTVWDDVDVVESGEPVLFAKARIPKHSNQKLFNLLFQRKDQKTKQMIALTV
jgi:hypothetical protein